MTAILASFPVPAAAATVTMHLCTGHHGREGNVMANPWTKKNPFMSMWLSSANSVLGTARARATAETKRQAAAAQADATRQILDFWSGNAAAPATKKRRR